MKACYSLIILCSLCIQISYAQATLAQQKIADFKHAIGQSDFLSKAQLAKQKLPGLAVAVGIGSETVWAEGYGYADIETRVKVDPENSLFRIGSVSKTLTAVALQLLVQDGKINLEEDVRKYVSYFPEKEHSLRVNQVAGHIAGVRHYASPMEMMSNVYYPTVKEGMEIFMHDDLLFAPGEKYSYSSYGWNLISAIIEEASQVPFLEYMQEEVFDRLELTKTQAEIRSNLPSDIVSFYIKEMHGVNTLAPNVDNSYKWAGGGFISSATDLLKFSYGVHHSDFIDERVLAKFQTPLTLNSGKKTNYGLGWSTNTDKKGRRWVGHSGGSVGGSTMYLYYPDYDLTVITLVNLSSAKMDQLAWRIAEQFISSIDASK